MRVFRWELKCGTGPYYADWGKFQYEYDSFLSKPHSAPNRPCREEDGISCIFPSCGFVSLEKEGEWFYPHEREAMLSAGFRLVEYEVDEAYVRVGKKQCVFDKRQAIFIGVIKCTISTSV